MRQIRLIMATAMLAAMAGCRLTGPLLDNPVLVPRGEDCVVENPVYTPLGPTSTAYQKVFEQVLDVVDDYFEIADANRYSGEIKTFPRIAPGCGQPWKPGSPSCYERALATIQTIRHRAFVKIQDAADGGYFVEVIVFRELEDLPRPTRATAGDAAFRSDSTVERQFEVVDPTVFESNWIPLGRDCHLEQAILQKLKKCM